MNLPIFHGLHLEDATYITFSKANLEYDFAIHNKSTYFFSKMMAIKLPVYANPDFYIDLNSVNITQTDPNITFPKAMQFYMENIIRNAPSDWDTIAEVAFYKTLRKMGVSNDYIKNELVAYVNNIYTSNFIFSENNNGWGEIICVVPNHARKSRIVWKNNDTINDILQSEFPNNGDDALYDNGDKQFLFNDETKQSVDFNNLQEDFDANEKFSFNALLIFYKDHKGVDKLHGINFIGGGFQNKVTNFELPTFTKKFNDSKSVGFQFKLNLKTVNNEASKILIEEHNDKFYLTQFETLSRLNTFLENNNVRFKI